MLAALVFAPPVFAWQETLTPDVPGPFPEVPEFRATFRIGWSEIEAAGAHAAIRREGGSISLAAGGGTTGFARALYQLDATFEGLVDAKSLHTVWSAQVENYSARTLTILIEGDQGHLRSLRESTPASGKPAKWKDVKIVPARDLFAGMLFIRSQKLAAGEKVRLVIFPGGSPFLVDIESRGVERLELAEGPREALRLDLKIQKVNPKKDNALEAHSKFRSGKIWLSNDAGRIPLRAEVDIFIGYVFAEIVDFRTP